MTLHSILSPRNEEGLPEAVTLDFSLKRMTLFAQTFNAKVGRVDPEGFSPFAPLGVAIAASMQWSRWVASGNEEALMGARELRAMLRVFGGRWRCVCKLLWFSCSIYGVNANLVVNSEIWGF